MQKGFVSFDPLDKCYALAFILAFENQDGIVGSGRINQRARRNIDNRCLNLLYRFTLECFGYVNYPTVRTGGLGGFA